MLALTANSRATLAGTFAHAERAKRCWGHARVRAGDTRACPSTHRAQCEPRAIPHRPVRILLVCGSFCFKSHFPVGARATRKHLKGYETPGNFPELDAHFQHLLTVSARNERKVLRRTGTKSDQINTHGSKQDAECTNHVRPGLILVRPGLIFVQYCLNLVRHRTNCAIRSGAIPNDDCAPQ
jgi:hypothetical protein